MTAFGLKAFTHHRAGLMTIDSLRSELEREISLAVASSYPAEWDENHITYSWLKAIRFRFGASTLYSPIVPISVSMRGYKQRGKIENLHGDVGVHVLLNLPGGEKRRGVGYLEAKVRDRVKATFPAYKVTQLRKIRRHSGHALLLLYDHAPITARRPGSVGSPSLSRGLVTHYTHATTIPVNTALMLGFKDTRLYPHSIPLASQLVDNFMFGVDLHADDKAIKRVEGFSDGSASPSFILSVVASIGRGAAGETAEMPFVNSDLYEEIGETS